MEILSSESDDIEDQHQKIMNDIHSMKLKFVQLLEKIWKLIDDVEGTKLLLLELNVLNTADIEMVTEAKSILDIRTLLSRQKYWTFLDYEILKPIIQLKSRDPGQQLFADYCKKVKEFCERHVTEFPPGYLLGDGTECYPGMHKLYVTLDLSDPSLNYITKHLKRVIANILGCVSSKLVICNIHRGSVEVTFLMVASFGDKLFEKALTNQQEKALEEEYVLVLKYESKTIYSNAQSSMVIPPKDKEVIECPMEGMLCY